VAGKRERDERAKLDEDAVSPLLALALASV